MPEKSQNVRRCRAARRDASVGRTTQVMERIFGLPKGSVRIINPNGRVARSDKTVGRLRDDYTI